MGAVGERGARRNVGDAFVPEPDFRGMIPEAL
jgi:hypothetical protein